MYDRLNNVRPGLRPCLSELLDRLTEIKREESRADVPRSHEQAARSTNRRLPPESLL